MGSTSEVLIVTLLRHNQQILVATIMFCALLHGAGNLPHPLSLNMMHSGQCSHGFWVYLLLASCCHSARVSHQSDERVLLATRGSDLQLSAAFHNIHALLS